MNGKKAKYLRKMARVFIFNNGQNPEDGYNKYNQAMNCISMERFTWEDGKLAVDGNGTPLLKAKRKPGTITCAYKQRIAYQTLKKTYMKGN